MPLVNGFMRDKSVISYVCSIVIVDADFVMRSFNSVRTIAPIWRQDDHEFRAIKCIKEKRHFSSLLPHAQYCGNLIQ